MLDLIRTLQLNLPPFALSVLKLCFWLVLLSLIFIPLERLFSLRGQKVARRGLGADLGYYFLNSLLPNLILAFPLALVAWFAHRFVPYRLHVAVGALPVWARLAGALVVGEIGFYWGHRLCHQIPFLWRFHAVHHSAEQIDWLVNTRAHPFDMVFERFCGYAPLYLLGFIQASRGDSGVTPMVIALIGTFWGFFIHANVRWRFGWLGWIISTPAFHHWHHTNCALRDKNFAPLMPWVDKLFGTLHLPAKQWPTSYGVDTPVAPGMIGQLLDPLAPAGNTRRRVRDEREALLS